MSNLLTHFPETNKLFSVRAESKRNGRIVYLATFADGQQHVIRTSGRLYKSVTQCGDGRGKGNCEFLFSGKAVLRPSLSSYQQGRFITTVQIHQAA